MVSSRKPRAAEWGVGVGVGVGGGLPPSTTKVISTHLN